MLEIVSLAVLQVLKGLPSVDPNAEGEDVVDPVFRIFVFVVFARDGFASRQAIRALVLVGWDVDKLEVKEHDCSNPAVYSCVRLHVRVLEHALDVLSIHLYDEVSDAGDVYIEGAESAKEPIELDLQLGVALLVLVPGDGAEA